MTSHQIIFGFSFKPNYHSWRQTFKTFGKTINRILIDDDMAKFLNVPFTLRFF